MDLVLAPATAVAVVAGLALEVRLFSPSGMPRQREALAWSAGWLLLAVVAAAGIAISGGPTEEWTAVYLIERSLSLDNVFLFSLLLAYFLVPEELRGRVIVIGIAGALVLRALAIAGGLVLIESVEAIVYVFGVLLVFVAYRALRGAGEESDPSANPVLRFVRRAVPTADDFRALVDILVARFRYIDETIALILAFVGIKILLADVVHIGDLASLCVIATFLAGGCSPRSLPTGSTRRTRWRRRPVVRRGARGSSGHRRTSGFASRMAPIVTEANASRRRTP
jgi:predicted tellurium resistance membrane protein TerC